VYFRIAYTIEEQDNYFVQRRNATRAPGFSCPHKVTIGYRQLAYGVPVNYVDEYVRIGESTTIEFLTRYVRAICEVFGQEYIRHSNEDDIARLLNTVEQRGFLGMLGSINCMH
jgi:hypothetical protein